MKRTPKQEAGWRCPDCGRPFRQRTIEHSCDVRSVSAHLEKASPEVRSSFETLRRLLERCGAHELIAVKTMIVFNAGVNFGGIVVRRSWLDVGFFLARPLSSRRIQRSERLSASKFVHHVRISSPDEVDGEIESWLREAYESRLVRQQI